LLFRAYHLKLGREIAKQVQSESIVINWTPDLPTVQQLLLETGKANDREVELVYPGHGLSQLELAELKKYFPQIGIASWTTFELKLWELAG
jgi:hypothetical protein